MTQAPFLVIWLQSNSTTVSLLPGDHETLSWESYCRKRNTYFVGGRIPRSERKRVMPFPSWTDLVTSFERAHEQAQRKIFVWLPLGISELDIIYWAASSLSLESTRSRPRRVLLTQILLDKGILDLSSFSVILSLGGEWGKTRALEI